MLHLVVNPIAGRGRGLPRLDAVVRTLADAGHEVQVHRTIAPGHARALVRALPDGAVAIAVGGDGTVHEVAAASLERSAAMGLVPTGSGDDFAFALGLDRFDMDAAARIVAAGEARRVDVGTVNDLPFVNGFGSGFDADVAQRVLRAPSLYRGLGRYLYGIATAMRDFALHDVAVRVDGREVYAGPALLVGVQNGPRAGGSFMFSPTAQPDDGLLDVLIAGEFGRLGTLGVLPQVMRGRHIGRPKIHFVRGREVDVVWSAPVAAHMDGEPFAAPMARYRVAVSSGALEVFAPNGMARH